jgi:hypothetical protein
MKILLYCAILIGVCYASYNAGRQSIQGANELIRAGFTIIDCEGYIVDEFDDSAASIKPSYWIERPAITDSELQAYTGEVL